MKRENERERAALPLTGSPDPPGATGRSCWFRRLAAALLVAMAASAFAAPALAQTEVPADWSLKPTGLAAGAQFRLLFLSSTERNGSSTAIADYNTFVQAAPRPATPISGPTARASGRSAALPPSTLATTPAPPARASHLLAQRRQGRRRLRGFLRPVLGRRGQRQERVRYRRPRYFQPLQLPPHRLP